MPLLASLLLLQMVGNWFDLLLKLDPSYGYFPEPSKCFIIVAPSDIPAAHSLFKDLGVQVTTGHHFLGGIIGNDESKRNFVEEEVDGWVECVHKLTAAAKKAPQAAFFAIKKSLQCKWSYLQRVSHLSDQDFQKLCDAICKHFLPALFQGNISNDEEEFFFLPVHLAGLGMRDPTKTATTAYCSSKLATQVVHESVKGVTEFSVAEHLSKLKETVAQARHTQNAADLAKLNTLISMFSPEIQQALRRAKSGTSSWLTSTPLERYHFDLSPNEFKDGLAILYLRHPADLPAHVMAVELTTLQHAKRGA